MSDNINENINNDINTTNNKERDQSYLDILNVNILNIKKIETMEETEDNSKEWFKNSPIIYFFLKIILLFEGDILRILLQLGDLYMTCIVTNFFLEILIIHVCAAADSNTFIKVYGFISAFIFCFLMRRVITIAFWELYQ